MTAALKIAFALYALNATFFAFRNLVPYPTPTLLLAAFFSLSLLPVAWGLVLERKWAWNCAVGLVIFRFCWFLAQIAGLFISTVVHPPVLNGVFLRTFALSFTLPVVVLFLLILARASYRTEMVNGDTNRTSYVRPVSAGVSFLIMGLLTFMHPLALHESPTLLRIFSFIFVAFLWIGAALCFFERPWRTIRACASAATIIAALGLIFSITFYSYFAILGLLVGFLQLLLGSVVIFSVRKSLPPLTPLAVA